MKIFPEDKLDNSCDGKNSKIKVEVSEDMKELFKKRCNEHGYSMSRMIKYLMQMINTKAWVMVNGFMVMVPPRARQLSVHDLQEILKKELFSQPTETPSAINSKSVKKKSEFEKQAKDNVTENKEVINVPFAGKPLKFISMPVKAKKSNKKGFDFDFE